MRAGYRDIAPRSNRHYRDVLLELAPEFLTYALMHTFRECFREAVGECLQKYVAIVVMIRLKV